MKQIELENRTSGGRHLEKRYYALKGPYYGSAADLAQAWRSTFSDNVIRLNFGVILYVEDDDQVIPLARYRIGLEIQGLIVHTTQNRHEIHRSINREGCAEILGIVTPPSVRVGSAHEQHVTDLPFKEGDQIKAVYNMNQQIGRLVWSKDATGTIKHFVYVPPEFARNDGFPDLPLSF